MNYLFIKDLKLNTKGREGDKKDGSPEVSKAQNYSQLLEKEKKKNIVESCQNILSSISTNNMLSLHMKSDLA